jgi:hypothetical protein
MKNRNIILILFLVSLTYSESLASMQFGVKMGMVSSKYEIEVLSFDQTTDVVFDQTRNGPIMGIYLRFLDVSFINLESEFNYLQRGGQEKLPITTPEQPQGTGEEIVFSVQFDYFQLQLNSRPNYSFKKYNVFGIIGISVNYLLGVKNSVIPIENFKDFTFSYSLGAGIELQALSNHSFFIEFTLNSDISNIYKDLDTEFMYKTYTIRLGIGF